MRILTLKGTSSPTYVGLSKAETLALRMHYQLGNINQGPGNMSHSRLVKACAYPCNIREFTKILVDAVIEDFGQIDGFITNSGKAAESGGVLDGTDQSFADASIIEPSSRYQPRERFFTYGPRFHGLCISEMYERQCSSKYDTITVGETPYVTDIQEIIKTVGSTAKELNMAFNFDHMEIKDVKTKGESKWSLRDWKLTGLKEIISGWQKRMKEWDGWDAIFLECHNQARSISRFTNDTDVFRNGVPSCSLFWSIYLYQGQEIGMRNFPVDWDPETE
ncbi:hypothetical protein BDV06DRAFT_221661 [Aspergillus oleicola]